MSFNITINQAGLPSSNIVTIWSFESNHTVNFIFVRNTYDLSFLLITHLSELCLCTISYCKHDSWKMALAALSYCFDDGTQNVKLSYDNEESRNPLSSKILASFILKLNITAQFSSK